MVDRIVSVTGEPEDEIMRTVKVLHLSPGYFNVKAPEATIDALLEEPIAIEVTSGRLVLFVKVQTKPRRQRALMFQVFTTNWDPEWNDAVIKASRGDIESIDGVDPISYKLEGSRFMWARVRVTLAEGEGPNAQPKDIRSYMFETIKTPGTSTCNNDYLTSFT